MACLCLVYTRAGAATARPQKFQLTGDPGGVVTGAVTTPRAQTHKPTLAKEVKQLSWFQKYVLCMNVEIHKEQHRTHNERLDILQIGRAHV